MVTRFTILVRSIGIVGIQLVVCISRVQISAMDEDDVFTASVTTAYRRSAPELIRPGSIRPTSAPNAVDPPQILERSAPSFGSFRPDQTAPNLN